MRRLTFSLVFLVGLTALEWMVLERLLYSDAESVAFVVESVRGVLSGTPVSKSWQHRFVAPTLVSLFGGARPEAVARFAAVGLYATNLLLFGLLWRRGVRHVSAIASVVGLGLAHFVLAYRLEYPWDVVDQLLFVAFGAWAARGGKLLPLAPLLLIATFNHETALYIPLWYLLSANRREQVTALGSAGVMAGLIAAARAAFYVGRPLRLA